jgi:hypothetical protein
MAAAAMVRLERLDLCVRDLEVVVLLDLIP